MIYLMLFEQFFLIGLFAVGGGAATIPFLFDLSQKYGWFSPADLTNMIAISEATPGPIGVNMATFAGIKTAGLFGGVVATFGLVLPSFIIITLIVKILTRFDCKVMFNQILKPLLPAVAALILNAALQIASISLKDVLNFCVLCFILIFMRYYKAGPIFFIALSALLGYTLKL